MNSSDPRQRPERRGEGARRELYSRFIPREELSSFAAWALGDVSAAGGSIRPGRRATDAVPGDPAKALAQQLHAARQSGYQDGYRDGLVALEGFKQSFAQQTTTQVLALVRSVGDQLDSLQHEMATALAQAATSLARQVIRSELTAHPECVAAVAEQAVEALLMSARHIAVHIHPDDHALVAGASAESLVARGARIVADACVDRGGCLVESDIGLVDATIDERWRRAAAALGSEQPWHDATPPVLSEAKDPGDA